MQKISRGFGSDNHAGVHPQILAAMTEINSGHYPAYQTDAVCEQATQRFQEIFGKCQVKFVFNGTAANILALSCFAKSINSVIVTDCSHIHNDECGAPEKNLGLKILPVPHYQGKMSIEQIQPLVIRRGDQHFSQLIGISITQPTELGTVYSLQELGALRKFTKENGLYLHIDGARLGNASHFLNCQLSELTQFADVVSLGGTKNGLLFGEAVLIMNQSLGKDFQFARKQLMQLPSKTRFIGAQFNAYFANSLYSSIAAHQCTMALQLRKAIENLTDWEITQPTQSNAVFVKIPKQFIGALRDKFFFYVWDENSFECRLMTSWDTSENDILEFSRLITGLVSKT